MQVGDTVIIRDPPRGKYRGDEYLGEITALRPTGCAYVLVEAGATHHGRCGRIFCPFDTDRFVRRVDTSAPRSPRREGFVDDAKLHDAKLQAELQQIEEECEAELQAELQQIEEMYQHACRMIAGESEGSESEAGESGSGASGSGASKDGVSGSDDGESCEDHERAALDSDDYDSDAAAEAVWHIICVVVIGTFVI